MPFAVFRRHQRKLLAIFAILAMAAFVLSDTLVRMSSGGSGRNVDPVIVELYGSKYHGADLENMKAERNNANQFMYELSALIDGRPIPNYFGDLSNRSIVDAIILAHQADKLSMPVGPDVAREWLKKVTRGAINKDVFELILARFNNRITGEQLLSEIGNQVRIINVRGLLGRALVTPLDVYETYRVQNEKVSARVVGFPVDDFIKQVKDPSDSEVNAYYDKYKDILPDPTRDTPGFKIPRQIKVEVLSVDGEALERDYKSKLTEADLRTYYENHKSDYKEESSSLPDDLFVDDPNAELTPPLIRPFDEVKESIAVTLAAEKAHEDILTRFSKIKEDVIDKFVDKYLDAKDLVTEAEKARKTPTVQLPKPESLKSAAEGAKLEYEVTPLLSRDAAEHYGMMGDAEVGLTKFSGGKKFAAELFDPKVGIFEGVELTNSTGRRYLVRKIEDNPAHVPPLDQIRSEVVHAWKEVQARPLAEKAATELAEKVKKEGGVLKGPTVDGRAVTETDLVSEMQPSVLPGQFFPFGPPAPSTITQIPNAGDVLRKTVFGLKSGEAAVAPNQPKTVYYVVTLNKRDPAKFATLYAPTSDYIRYRLEASNSAQQRLNESWMKQLRAEAGLKPDWAPPEETKKAEEAE